MKCSSSIRFTECDYGYVMSLLSSENKSWSGKHVLNMETYSFKKNFICLIVSQIYSDNFSYTFFTDGLFHVSFGVTTSCHQKNSTRLKKFMGIFQVSFTKLLQFCFGVDRTFDSRVGIIQPFVQNQSIFFV